MELLDLSASSEGSDTHIDAASITLSEALSLTDAKPVSASLDRVLSLKLAKCAPDTEDPV
ncbi:unnamed protein product, partial [Protopolystoma xenopodis]